MSYEINSNTIKNPSFGRKQISVIIRSVKSVDLCLRRKFNFPHCNSLIIKIMGVRGNEGYQENVAHWIIHSVPETEPASTGPAQVCLYIMTDSLVFL